MERPAVAGPGSWSDYIESALSLHVSLAGTVHERPGTVASDLTAVATRWRSTISSGKFVARDILFLEDSAATYYSMKTP